MLPAATQRLAAAAALSSLVATVLFAYESNKSPHPSPLAGLRLQKFPFPAIGFCFNFAQFCFSSYLGERICGCSMLFSFWIWLLPSFFSGDLFLVILMHRRKAFTFQCLVRGLLSSPGAVSSCSLTLEGHQFFFLGGSLVMGRIKAARFFILSASSFSCSLPFLALEHAVHLLVHVSSSGSFSLHPRKQVVRGRPHAASGGHTRSKRA
jgi:hypothetical protein